MRTILRILIAGMTFSIAGCGAFNPPLPVVEKVDVEQYMGRWYEIARYPNWFQADDCIETTAEYTLLDNGTVRVVNKCNEENGSGPVNRIEGNARIVDMTTNAKLKVRFDNPFEGDYWIIDLDEDYQWAVVGSPSRQFLWILSRTPTMDDEVYRDIISRLPANSYEPYYLEKTPQTEE